VEEVQAQAYHASGTCHILAMCSVMYSTFAKLAMESGCGSGTAYGSYQLSHLPMALETEHEVAE